DGGVALAVVVHVRAHALVPAQLPGELFDHAFLQAIKNPLMRAGCAVAGRGQAALASWPASHSGGCGRYSCAGNSADCGQSRRSCMYCSSSWYWPAVRVVGAPFSSWSRCRLRSHSTAAICWLRQARSAVCSPACFLASLTTQPPST